MIADPEWPTGDAASGALLAEPLGPESFIRSVTVDDAVTVEDHLVVYRDGAVHVLNPTAALIWNSCDVDVTVATLADEFAQSFAAGYPTVLADVLATLGGLVERGLVERIAGGRATTPDPTPPILQPLPACSGCGEGPSYECHVIVDLGGVGVSIGADAEVAAALAAALGPRVLGLETAPGDRSSYGIVVPAGQGGRGPVALARLHRGPDVLLTSRDPLRVLRAALAQVATHRPAASELLLEGTVVGREGRVVVVPSPGNRVGFERGAAEFGLGVSDASMAMVSLRPAQVTIGADELGVDFAPLESLAASRRHLAEPARLLPWGSHELVAVAVNGAPNAATVIGEVGPRLGSRPAGATPLAPLLSLPRVVRVERGTSPADIDRLLGTT